jgi:WhiB family transcriptional regulator, redox-sensing transcriptional regulator
MKRVSIELTVENAPEKPAVDTTLFDWLAFGEGEFEPDNYSVDELSRGLTKLLESGYAENLTVVNRYNFVADLLGEQPIEVSTVEAPPTRIARRAVPKLVFAPPDATMPVSEEPDGGDLRSSGNCKDYPPATFFPSDAPGTNRAKRICASCGVAALCLEYALDTGQDHGVWGGASERERRRILNRRRLAQ